MASMIPFSNVLPVALVGAVFAMIEFYRSRDQIKLEKQLKEVEDQSQGGGMNDGI